MPTINTLCVFCGSRPGNDPAYKTACDEMAEALSTHQITLVYGGSQMGLMDVLANAMLKKGGQVIGVSTQALKDKEVVHKGLTKLHLEKNLSERQAKMETLSDAFVLMPGGFGSLDEFFSMLTLTEMGFHKKPLGILNTNDYYQPLLDMLQQHSKHGFTHPDHVDMIQVSDNSATLIKKLQSVTLPEPKFAF